MKTGLSHYFPSYPELIKWPGRNFQKPANSFGRDLMNDPKYPKASLSTLPNPVYFTRTTEIHLLVSSHCFVHFLHSLNILFELLPIFFISGKALIFAYHNYSVILAGYIRHDINQLVITGHCFLELFRELGRIARFAYKNIVNNNHNSCLVV